MNISKSIKIDPTLKISDILTSLSILISVIVFVNSWSQDLNIRTKEQADAVRTAAASALIKLEHWQALQLSVFDDLQPIFVTTSRMLQPTPTETNVLDARDYLWTEIEETKSALESKIIEAEIEAAYVQAFAYFPTIADTLPRLENIAQESFGAYIEASQDDVRSFSDIGVSYTPAMLGNALRATAVQYRAQIQKDTEEIIQPIRALLLEKLALSDQDVLASTLRS